MARRPVIAANWKMNGTWASCVKLAQQVSYLCDKQYPEIDIVLIPPFTTLKGVGNVLFFDKSDIKVGAQNVYEDMPEGTAAATSQISVEMLKDLECEYCIVGHSECRAYGNESDEMISKKVKLLLDHGITPIICCGESAEANAAGKTTEIVCNQIEIAISGLTAETAASTVIAYEPIWAIGTGNVPIPENVDETCGAIRDVVRKMYGDEAADQIRILYGGSLKPENAHQFLPLENVDGGLIGSASLNAQKFADIIKAEKEYLK